MNDPKQDLASAVEGAPVDCEALVADDEGGRQGVRRSKTMSRK